MNKRYVCRFGLALGAGILILCILYTVTAMILYTVFKFELPLSIALTLLGLGTWIFLPSLFVGIWWDK